MNSVLAQLQPPKHHFGDDEDRRELERDAAEWGSMGGFGNLGRSGAVEGMSVPRVLDVSDHGVVSDRPGCRV
jgi:20S proteasome subunit beta 5